MRTLPSINKASRRFIDVDNIFVAYSTTIGFYWYHCNLAPFSDAHPSSQSPLCLLFFLPPSFTFNLYPKRRLLVGVGEADTRAKAKLQHEPLHVACLGNWGQVVKFLLTEGHADAEARDKNGMSPLHLAIERNKLESILELTKHG